MKPQLKKIHVTILKNLGIYERYIQRVEEYEIKKIKKREEDHPLDNYLRQQESFIALLIPSFPWAETKEGYLFWAEACATGAMLEKFYETAQN